MNCAGGTAEKCGSTVAAGVVFLRILHCADGTAENRNSVMTDMERCILTDFILRRRDRRKAQFCRGREMRYFRGL